MPVMANYNFPNYITIEVTGHPVNVETIEDSIKTTIKGKLLKVASNNLDVKVEIKNLAPVYDQDVFITVNCYITNFEEILITKSINVQVVNKQLQLKPPQKMFMSNFPESIESEEDLFNFDILSKQSGRFLFHHKALDRKFKFSIIAYNIALQPGKLFISKSIGGPNVDSLFVGHTATEKFFRKELKQEGFFINFGPLERIEIYGETVKPFETITGIMNLQSISGNFSFEILAYSDEFKNNLYFNKEEENEKEVKSGFFDTTETNLSYDFKLFDKEKVFRIGEEPKLYDTVSKKLYRGNYGLIYNFDILLDNRYSPKNRYIGLYLKLGGGMVRGIFNIDNSLYSTKLLQSIQEETLIKKIKLLPDEIRRINVKTMPQPGSYYPVSFIVREVN